MLFFSNTCILAMRKAAKLGLHSRLEAEQSFIFFFFFSLLGSAVLPSETNSQLFLDSYSKTYT